MTSEELYAVCKAAIDSAKKIEADEFGTQVKQLAVYKNAVLDLFDKVKDEVEEQFELSEDLEVYDEDEVMSEIPF